ncbi:MAG: hypothetical protein WD011_08870 [Nitriliruptoraceae bacterium]
MADDDGPLSPDVLLRHAAAGDAARALDVLATVNATKLLDAVFTQAELAVEDGSARRAGLDAIAELDRAAIEIMDLPQSSMPDVAEIDSSEGPTLVGWELATVAPEDVTTAALVADVRPWMLAVVAFADTLDRTGDRYRRVVAAAADGRLVAGQLRYATGSDAPDLLDGIVARRAADLTDDATLATTLLATLRAAARGR